MTTMPDLSQLAVSLWTAEDHGWQTHDAKAVALDTRAIDLEIHFDLAARLVQVDQAHVVVFGDDGVSALVEVDRGRTGEPGRLSFRFVEPALLADTWVGEWMSIPSS